MRARAVVALGFVATLGAVGICAGVWATTDFSSTSTAPLALFFIPGWGLGATIVIWLLVWGRSAGWDGRGCRQAPTNARATNDSVGRSNSSGFGGRADGV